MDRIPSKMARLKFTDVSDEVAFAGKQYIVTRNGRDLFAMISMEDYEVLQALENKRDIEAAEKAEKYITEHGTDTWSEIEKRLGIDEV